MARVNPAIKPQTGDHYETGVRYAFRDWLEGGVTVFLIDTKDEIFFNPQTFTNENFPKTRRIGVEVGAKAKPLSWLSLRANYGYTEPLLKAEPFKGSDIPGVPRHKGSIGAEVAPPGGLLFSTAVNYIGSRYFISDFANRVRKQGGYYTVDARLSYSWKGLTGFFGVNNLFDRKYSEFGVVNAFGTPFFYPSPERNFIGGLSYTF